MRKRTDKQLGIHIESPDDLDTNASVRLVRDILANAYNSLVEDIVFIETYKQQCEDLEKRKEQYDNFKKAENCFIHRQKRYELYKKNPKIIFNKLTTRQTELIKEYLKLKDNPPTKLTYQERNLIATMHDTILDRDRTISFYWSDTFKTFSLGAVSPEKVIKEANKDANVRIHN